MKKILLGLVLAMTMFACTEKSPDCGDPKSINCELILMDSQKTLLIGTKYNPDSIRLQVNKSQIPIVIYEGIINFNFAGFDTLNASDYILKLNNHDSETLKMYIRKFINPCWTGYSLDTVQFNDQILSTITGNRYELIK